MCCAASVELCMHVDGVCAMLFVAVMSNVVGLAAGTNGRLHVMSVDVGLISKPGCTLSGLACC